MLVLPSKIEPWLGENKRYSIANAFGAGGATISVHHSAVHSAEGCAVHSVRGALMVALDRLRVGVGVGSGFEQAHMVRSEVDPWGRFVQDVMPDGLNHIYFFLYLHEMARPFCRDQH